MRVFPSRHPAVIVACYIRRGPMDLIHSGLPPRQTYLHQRRLGEFMHRRSQRPAALLMAIGVLPTLLAAAAIGVGVAPASAASAPIVYSLAPNGPASTSP